jgi:NAD(P)H-hydrate epimerase
LIRWANSQRAPILALDVPSGMDAGSGTVYEPVIRASATLTLALPKKGLRMPGAEALVGELYLADISVPPELYASLPLELSVGPLFCRADVIRLR